MAAAVKVAVGGVVAPLPIVGLSTPGGGVRPHRRKRLDGTILGLRRLGNLPVPSRLPGDSGEGVAQSLNGSHLPVVGPKSSLARFSQRHYIATGTSMVAV
jgi:hypothetical protein